MSDHYIVGVALDAAQVAAIFDSAAVPGGPREFGDRLDASGIDVVLLRPGGGTRFDPSIAATILARHTRSVGLVVGGSVLRDHPYNLARRLGSIDHASAGRAGWLVSAGAPGERSVWSAAPPGDIPADAVAAVRELWESWPPGSIVDDRAHGVFAESEQIRYIDHVGAHSISGPLNLPEPPQAKPPIFVESPVAPEFGGLAAQADILVGAAGGPDAVPTLRWCTATAVPGVPGDGIAGVVVAGAGAPLDILTAAARHVRAPAPPPGTTLRARLGLPAPAPVLSAAARSAFPA